LRFCKFLEFQGARKNPKTPAETQSPLIENFAVMILLSVLGNE